LGRPQRDQTIGNFAASLSRVADRAVEELKRYKVTTL
jgi:hypothetical protein